MVSDHESNDDPRDWMTLRKAAAQLQCTVHALHLHIKFQLVAGVHFRKLTGGRIELHMPAYRKWLAQQPRRPRKPLIERIDWEVTRAVVESKEKKAQAPTAKPRTSETPKLVPVRIWAQQMFGEYGPAQRTLQGWVRDGKIYPVPRKIGREYYCSPQAQYIGDS